MRTSLRSILTLTSLSLVALSGGASAIAAPDDATAPIVVETPSADTQVYGSVQMLGEALDEVSLRSDQAETISDLGLAMAPFERAVDQSENELLAALAEQVRAGQIDRTALQPHVDAYVQARQAFAAPFQAALAMLHLVLDNDQRADFADALEARIHDAVSTELSRTRVAELEEALGADQDQRARIDEAFAGLVPELQAERDAVHAAIEGFRGDNFDLDQYLPTKDVASRAQARAEDIIEATEEMLGDLDEAQRHMLADRIESAAHVAGETHHRAPVTPPHHAVPEKTGEVAQHMWIRGFGYGPWGRRGMVVAGPGAWFGARIGAFPIAAGWGLGW